MILSNREIDEKIVLFGQSCVGKTTFAKQLVDHHYYCFDALFDWHSIESFGLSIDGSLKYIREICDKDRWVLDGWHLADASGNFLPDGAKVYVVYAEYEKIISQYRVPVHRFDEHHLMFLRWYQIDYTGARFFRNDGNFVETDYHSFCKVIS